VDRGNRVPALTAGQRGIGFTGSGGSNMTQKKERFYSNINKGNTNE
jgi:hypothetical protein